MTKKNDIIFIDEERDQKEFKKNMQELLQLRRAGKLPNKGRPFNHSV